MPKKKSATIDINLVPKDPFFQTVLGKTFKWMLSVGRYIVIFTELVVIVSFVTRFTLDRQVTDLNDSINQKKNVIESYGDLEKDFRLAQLKIDNYLQIEQQTNLSDVFPGLSAITPSDIQLDELVIRPTGVSISGIAFNQKALNLLINNIQLSPDFFNVNVDRIEAGDEKTPGFKFRLRADTKEAPKLVNR